MAFDQFQSSFSKLLKYNSLTLCGAVFILLGLCSDVKGQAVVDSIPMAIDTVQLPLIEILDKYSKPLNVLVRMTYDEPRSVDVGSLMRTNILADTRSQGPGMLSTISLNGLGPQRTNVVWGQVPISSSMNGVVDLSLIPVFLTDNFSIFTIADTVFSQFSGGNSFYIRNKIEQSQEGKHRISISAGMYGQYAMRGSYTFYTKNEVKSTTDVQVVNEANRFRYKNTYRIGQPIETLTHARRQMANIRQHFEKKAKNGDYWSAVVWVNAAERELAASMVQAKSQDKQYDRGLRASAAWSHAYARARHRISLGHNAEYIRFLTPSFDDTSRAYTTVLRWEGIRETKRWQWLLGASGQYEIAKSDGYTDPTSFISRYRWSPTVKVQYHIRDTSAVASILIRPEWIGNKTYLPTSQWRFYYPISSQSTADIELSTSSQVPTFNDLFWRGLGNQSLRAEQTMAVRAGFDTRWLEVDPSHRLSLYGTSQWVDHWILWQPDASGLWRPNNLRKVWSRQVIAVYVHNFKVNDRIHYIRLRYRYTDAVQVASYDNQPQVIGKQLIYTPRHSTSLELFYQLSKSLKLIYSHRYQSRRFTTADNSTWLKGYQCADLEIHYLKNARKKKAWDCNLALENIYNSPYELIATRPMPGRNVRLSVSYGF
jgi:vitamin B12 transporter